MDSEISGDGEAKNMNAIISNSKTNWNLVLTSEGTDLGKWKLKEILYYTTIAV